MAVQAPTDTRPIELEDRFVQLRAETMRFALAEPDFRHSNVDTTAS